MTKIFAKHARLPTGWSENVVVAVRGGVIQSATPKTSPPVDAFHVDALLPALSNLHSHAFQRAMAGMTERRSAGRDSFWTWRDLMYRFANRIAPEELEAIAAQAYMEMMEAGYAAVGEFHYLHHAQDGAQYAAIDELSQRIFAAALQTGVGLTHLPVLYSYGGAGKAPLAPEQRRFGNSLDRFDKIVEEARCKLPFADACIGIAPHSLRAVSPDELKALLAKYRDGPVHIHVAEQPKEVEDVKAWLGARPIEWLMDNLGVDGRWCAVHATHMTDAETLALAASGAVAGLCPITEANLGDGAFNGPTYLNAGGAFGIGSDSNVRIALGEELRLLEYSQRLRDKMRNVLVKDGFGVGESLYLDAAKGGAKALGRSAGTIEAGMLADLVAFDLSAPALCALKPEQILDGIVFASGDNVVTDVWSAGRHVVANGLHKARDTINANYKRAVSALIDRA